MNIIKKLNKLSEEDFMALRIPFESGRQHPKALGTMLLGTIPFNIIIIVLLYVTIGYDTPFPYKYPLMITHLTLAIITTILAIIYGIRSNYMRHQKMQYLTTIIASQQIFGLNFFVALLFLISSEYHTIIRLENVMPITLILIVIGLLVFVLKSMRYYWLLKQGAYRSESDRDMFRKTLEKTKSFMPVVIGATALYMIISNTGYSIYLINPERLVLYLSSILVYCAMMFVLPEQLVILYCKHRFQSFNYDEDGKLIASEIEREEFEYKYL